MSTITINLQNILGAAIACQVVFTPRDTPFINGSALAASGAQSVQTAADGTGSIVLLPGRYSVSFVGIAGNCDSLVIGVPNDNNTYPLTQLVNSGTTIPSPPMLASISTASIAYVETAGNDATGQIGNLSLPFASVQAAFAAALALPGCVLIKMGVGSWVVNLPVSNGVGLDWPSRIQLGGAGSGLTNLTVNGGSGDLADWPQFVQGSNLSICDALYQSFTGQFNAGTVTNQYGYGGADSVGGNVTLVNCFGNAVGGDTYATYAPANVTGGNVTMTGCTGNGTGGGGYFGAPGGSVVMTNCVGNATSGYDDGACNTGGVGGSVAMTGCTGNGTGGGPNDSCVTMTNCIGDGSGYAVTMINCVGNGINNSSVAGSVTMVRSSYQYVNFAAGCFYDVAIDGSYCTSNANGTSTHHAASGLPSSNTVSVLVP